MKKVKKEYKYVDPKTLVRSSKHRVMFRTKEESEVEGTIESFKLFDRLKPVFTIDEIFDGVIKEAWIDGDTYMEYAIASGIESVYVCKLTFEDESDIPRVMAELQTSHHTDLLSYYMMIMQLWPLYSKGSGYRSDLLEDEQNEEGDTARYNIYTKIGKVLKISGTKVKHIRKIGTVNKLYFQRIEEGRFPVYVAYLECLKEERGEMPDVPPVKKPVYTSTSTEVPAFSEPTTTETNTPNPEEDENSNADATADDDSEAPDEEENAQPIVQSHSQGVRVKAYCTCCNKVTEVIISQSK